MKFKNDIIELASKHGYLFKSFNHTKEYGFKVYKVKGDIDMGVTLKELKELIQENHVQVTLRLDNIDERLDNLIKKNNLVE